MDISHQTVTTTRRVFNFVGQSNEEAATLRDLHAALLTPNRVIRSSMNGATTPEFDHLLTLEIEEFVAPPVPAPGTEA